MASRKKRDLFQMDINIRHSSRVPELIPPRNSLSAFCQRPPKRSLLHSQRNYTPRMDGEAASISLPLRGKKEEILIWNFRPA